MGQVRCRKLTFNLVLLRRVAGPGPFTQPFIMTSPSFSFLMSAGFKGSLPRS